MRPFIVAAMMLSCACALPQVVPEASTDYKPSGEITLRSFNASFDAYRVRSPNANLAVRTDGSWAGMLSGRGIDVSADETTIRGVDLILSRADSKPGYVVITGQFQGKMLRFEFDETGAKIRTPKFSNSYQGRFLKDGAMNYGLGGELSLRGDAGGSTPPWPQLGLALLAAFEGDVIGGKNSSGHIGSDGDVH